MQDNSILNYNALIEAILPRLKDEVAKAIYERDVDENKRLTRLELCKRWHISPPTLWQYVKDGNLHPLYMGRRVLFTLDEVRRAEKVGISCKVRVAREKGARNEQ
jgi:hypothetical protein